MEFVERGSVCAGHCTPIPRAYIETLPAPPPERVGPLFVRAQLLCAAVEQALGADGTFLAVNNRVSQSVPHLHIHIVPRRRKDGLRGFFWPRNKYPTSEEMESVRLAIRKALERLEPRKV